MTRASDRDEHPFTDRLLHPGNIACCKLHYSRHNCP